MISLLLGGILISLTAWLGLAHAATQRRTLRETEIVTRGQCCQGKVLTVQRPFLFESTTRLYFEFAPPGAARPVQCCHTERRAPDGVAVALPTAGTFVTVLYLPDRPQDAVIGQLVARPA